MKLILATAAAVLTAVTGLTVQSTPQASIAETLTGDPQAPASQAKDRLPPERMDQLVARPMSVLRKSGLAAAQKDFDLLVADAAKRDGKDSAAVADLLTSFGVELFLDSFDEDDTGVAEASLDYLKRAIPACRAAFGARDPEVAMALNSYADAVLQVNGDAAKPDAEAALEEAYSIRLTALGADDPMTKITSDKLADVRSGRPFTAKDDATKAIVSAAAAVQGTAAAGEILTPADMDDTALWKPGIYFDPLIDEFIADAKDLGSADAASRKAIAAKYGLTLPALDSTAAFLSEMGKDEYKDRRKLQLRKDALQLVRLSNRAPIALELAAGALGQLAENGCSPSDLALLMQGSRAPDRDLWAVGPTCGGSRALAAAIDKPSAARPALLYLGMSWANGQPDAELAAVDMLLRPEFLARIDEQQRDAVHAEIASYKLTKLLHLGLLSEALAFGDSLSPGVRGLALEGRRDGLRTSIAGFPLKLGPDSTSPAIAYAAALAVAGRNAEARSLLDSIVPESKLRSVRACLDAATTEDCGVGDWGQGKVSLSALIVDQLLTRPGADPYVLMEQNAIGSSVDGAALTAALCRLLTQRDERKECHNRREADAQARASDQYVNQDDRALWTAIARADGQPFDVAKAAYAAKLTALGEAKAASWTRASVDPAPVPFSERPIPAEALAKAPLPSSDPKTMARLPEGYTLVRAERHGERVAAISLSQRFDPNGEVTAGGYWLHLSEDGGRTWQPPLYTGLAEHFPYVVPSSSRLPMVSGDRLHLEVEESLIDTASIGYPPVGTRVRRKRSGIYLDIPISELRKDSDGDGITDIAAHHLLLDGNAQAGAPFVVGRDHNCSSAPSPETLARLEILKKLFQVQARALIEPVGASEPHFGDWRRTEATGKPPIFMRGNPDDYRCVAIDRLMVVYPDAEQDQLRKFSPDFQLIELPAIVWNREHTRGFVNWSMGWTGGTYRVVRNDRGWELKSIGEWIT